MEKLVHKNVQIVPAVSLEERAQFQRDALLPNNVGLEATSEGYFRFDILDTPRSPWNRSAARVFADFTIHQLCLPNTVEMFGALLHAFTAHLETIIRRYKRSLRPPGELVQAKTRSRRRTRKYQVRSYLWLRVTANTGLAISPTTLFGVHVQPLTKTQGHARASWC